MFHKIVAQLTEPLDDVARFAYMTGWRKKEVLTLRWSDVDREAQRVDVESHRLFEVGVDLRGAGVEGPFARVLLGRCRQPGLDLENVHRRAAQERVDADDITFAGGGAKQFGGDFQLESGTAGTSILVVFPLKGSGARFAPQETSGVGISVT